MWSFSLYCMFLNYTIFIFYWSIVDLQCCVGFRCTKMWFSYTYIFFSYCSWGSQGKNTEVVCHSLLQWTTFCQTPPPWPARPGWPHTAWLSFIELDKTMVCVTRLASFLWLWFQCVCPLMPFCNTYRLTWVSLTLDVGYLLTAAPAKHSHRSVWSYMPLWAMLCGAPQDGLVMVESSDKMWSTGEGNGIL